MNVPLFFAHQALDDIYRRDAYCTAALDVVRQGLDEKDKRLVTRLVYGVLQHEYEWRWAMGRLCTKQPKAVVRVLLRLGMYLIKYVSSMPTYACVNEVVELTKGVKREYAGLVNATLKAYVGVMDDVPTDPLTAASVRYNLPPFAVTAYRRQYGDEGAEKRLQSRVNATHIRPCGAWDIDRLVEVCSARGIACRRTPHGVLASTAGLERELAHGDCTVQALDSIYIAAAVIDDMIDGDVLDMCAAPGGKSVYMAEKSHRHVVACDLHEHRAALIEAYARRVGVDNVTAMVCDNTVYRAEWANAFAAVLVDAPCSGLGVAMANPDIVMRRTEQGMAQLVTTQRTLLDNAARYVAYGGVLVYATCTDLAAENQEVVTAFLQAHAQFVLEPVGVLPWTNEGMWQFTPDDEGNEGFFVARMRKRG